MFCQSQSIVENRIKIIFNANFIVIVIKHNLAARIDLDHYFFLFFFFRGILFSDRVTVITVNAA